ncbi:hypothetical protein DEH84_14110 [Aquabacterium olei]|uniref:Uncharacterized protein n=1 Tax=Aquabacterium olei TaxID=1296669 RepID=A0A2U8FTQ5_9BURK|nr:hypothetical protein DEH84_14110 [Aquabacterium olei]
MVHATRRHGRLLLRAQVCQAHAQALQHRIVERAARLFAALQHAGRGRRLLRRHQPDHGLPTQLVIGLEARVRHAIEQHARALGHGHQLIVCCRHAGHAAGQAARHRGLQCLVVHAVQPVDCGHQFLGIGVGHGARKAGVGRHVAHLHQVAAAPERRHQPPLRQLNQPLLVRARLFALAGPALTQDVDLLQPQALDHALGHQVAHQQRSPRTDHRHARVAGHAPHGRRLCVGQHQRGGHVLPRQDQPVGQGDRLAADEHRQRELAVLLEDAFQRHHGTLLCAAGQDDGSAT